MRRLLPLLTCAAAAACATAPGPEQREVTATVQALFDAMRARDPDAARPLLADGAQFLSVAVIDGRARPRATAATSFLESLASGDEPWVERMFAPQVEVRGSFAFAQMDYDFHRGRTFSHHGVDQVLLVKEQDGWRVASIAYSVVRGERASPFGSL